MKYLFYLLTTLSLYLFGATFAYAHEAYVLPYETFWNGVRGPLSAHAFAALRDPNNIRVTSIIVVSVIVALLLNFAFRMSEMGKRLHAFLERYARFGPHLVRITIAVALFFSATSNSFLGPELHIDAFPHPFFIRSILFAVSGMIAVGFMTELAALVGVLLFSGSLFVYGPYIFTYLNYLGELIVLLLFGMRAFSVDHYLFGPLKRFTTFEKYESVIVRVLYGIALIYAAITVKLLHPELTVHVVNSWNLTQFHWLFPSDPLLVTLGAGIVETVIGLFIVFGFELRLTVLVSLFYITLSLLYFRELVWPHLLLYGISFNLLLQPETFTLDHLFFAKQHDEKVWWKRPFSAGQGKNSSN